MATIKTIQDQIDLKGDQYADTMLNSLSTKFKNYLLNNIDPAVYADVEVFKEQPLVSIFDAGSPVHTQLHRAFRQIKINELVTKAIQTL